MRQFEQYVTVLEDLARAALRGDDSRLEDVDFHGLLNGAVSAQLCERVTLRERQRIGAFFTGTALRERAVKPVLRHIRDNSHICDPACGAGDLLLSFADFLPLQRALEPTLEDWAERLHGFDIEPVFIRATRARLVLAAYSRGLRRSRARPTELRAVFPGVQVSDSLRQTNLFRKIGITALNPPFISVPAAHDCGWAAGKVSAAAVMLDRCLGRAAPGHRIVAILPDVLRSGSRYSAWRNLVASRADVIRVDVYGAFGPGVDVDVFVLELVAQRERPHKPTRKGLWSNSNHDLPSLGTICRITTGAVVPHRHAEQGREYAYLRTTNATPWATLRQITESRRFGGTVVQPPFVAVRRTSSPSDRNRPVATLVLGSAPVAVENHLLVIKPFRGGENACRHVMDILRRSTTRTWIDERIRTRHLTVAAMKELPLAAG